MQISKEEFKVSVYDIQSLIGLFSHPNYDLKLQPLNDDHANVNKLADIWDGVLW